ncbi:MAG: CHAT domain-containing protein, partial [Leptolyngbyaceae cyanobacterium MO_188.B28]|nr:CHAT domain-containing protein [Leptolyngbyaceae cyanobacterium MO_188.B28]
LPDQRAEAYALGELGHLYEVSSQWGEAKDLTEQAIHLAQGINGVDIEAPWQWQLGRILKQQGKPVEAIAAYTDAVHSLRFLRQELVTLDPDFQFSFTEKVEPVYRELVSLVLAQNPDQANLQTARELIQDLQYAELYNYFREPCLQATPQSIDGVDDKAAVIYPIILADRLVVIASMAEHPLYYYETRLHQSEIEAAIDQLRLYLNPHFFDEDRLSLSQQLYDWLIRPAETALADNDIQTLVFVLDGSLRSLPMAALHDGQQYLIEKYNVSLNPGLQLLEPRSLELGQLKTLTAGLSQSHRGFNALPAVEIEVNQIAKQVPSTVLLNQDFTSDHLKQVIDSVPFPVVHLATHGRYGAKVEDTFLVTWDSQINVRQLDELLRARERDIAHPLELLVLSACQTATGDKRAALGLAGFAIRSGARSTLATLWQVNDDSTAQLMVAFYQQLTQHPEITKAEALRQAQLQLLRQSAYQHPFYWAPFVLIGNWL